MSDFRERRNCGRLLGVVIESDDVRSRKGLQALSNLTRETFLKRGLDVAAWPTDVRNVLAGLGAASRFARIDTNGDEHVFAVADCGDFDLFFGVSTRRGKNVPGVLSGNLATNVLLEVLSERDRSDPTKLRYGQIGTEDFNRLWRTEVGAAHLQTLAREWDLVFWSRSDHLDYLQPGAALIGTVRGNQAAEQATAVVVNGSNHKAVAHTQGQLKYARGQTHPLIRVHPVTRAILGYNDEVVDAIREAVRLLRSGASWDEAALAVGARIPATQAQQEPDEDHGRERVRTRTARNATRAAQGRDPLPLRFLPDGNPNPDYRPETILDLQDPGDRLKSMLVWGQSVAVRDADLIASRVDADLDGIKPDDAFHEFYSTGVYRRLVKDHTLSNSSIVRYRWIELELGPTADGAFVLTPADIEFLRTKRSGRTSTGSWGNNPLTGVFRIEQPAPLYTRTGWLDPAAGAFRARSGSTGTTRGLRIWFEPLGSTPHSANCQALAWIPNTEIGPAISRLLVEAVTCGHDLAEFRFEHAARRDDPVTTARQAVADLERRLDATAVRLADPDLSDRTIAVLKRELTTIEQDLDSANELLTQTEAAAATAQTTHDDTFDITDLAQLAAVIGTGLPLTPRVADRAARLLRIVLHDPRLILDPATAHIRVEATLLLQSTTGILSVPLRTHVANHSTDPWVAGVAGMWWQRRTVPFNDLMTERGLHTTPGTATRWREPVARRLLADAARHGRPLRGPNLAALLVRCDNPTTLEQIRTAIETGQAPPALHTLLFDGPDLAPGTRWTTIARELDIDRSDVEPSQA